ncbi:hypothetical protein SLEP1_g18066 [Rubroshorea leprosula]|uniref:Uncharacterized protein n=1 Tax=Rubroshorea leprosula TaxID=152421 RepID=A0AAV5IW86_9ROSI|nr:hypothetical protein SLEP1_g18066 [Rubroshorea leprosula]
MTLLRSGGYQPITQISKGGRRIPSSGGHGASHGRWSPPDGISPPRCPGDVPQRVHK